MGNTAFATPRVNLIIILIDLSLIGASSVPCQSKIMNSRNILKKLSSRLLNHYSKNSYIAGAGFKYARGQNEMCDLKKVRTPKK